MKQIKGSKLYFSEKRRILTQIFQWTLVVMMEAFALDLPWCWLPVEMANAVVGVGVGGGGGESGVGGVRRLLLLLDYHRWPCLEVSGYRVTSHSHRLRNDSSTLRTFQLQMLIHRANL